MLEAHDQHADDVRHDEANRQIGQELVDVFDQLGAPVGVRGHHVARGARAGQRNQERNDHGAARRVVPDIAGSSEHHDVANIGEDFARRTNEARKSRMPRTDETPDDAGCEEPAMT